MKGFIRAVDRFCIKHPRFGIPHLILYVIGGTALVAIVSAMDTTGTFLSYLYFNAALILRGQIWRLVSFVFVPSVQGILWLVISLYFYYFVGTTLEQSWGIGKFTLFYLAGVILTIIFGFAISALYYRNLDIYIGLTGHYLNLSMFFAFAAMFPDTQVLLFFFIPIKIKWLALVDAVFFIYEVVVTTFPLNLLPVMAALNVILFCLDDFISLFRADHKTNVRRINFRREATAARQKEAAKPFRHRCEICGRTEKDNPELEFRFCSRCQGYHCFCSDHIYNHSHRTE